MNALTVQPDNQFALMQREAKLFAMSPLVPEHMRKGSPEQALANCYIALHMARAMDENPLMVMQNIYIIGGKAGWMTQYVIARANRSGIFKGRINWRVHGKGDALEVTAYAHLADDGSEVSATAGMAMAKAEGWTKNAKYQTMPEHMLRWRSAAFLVRLYAPEVMMGYQTQDEIVDTIHAGGPERAAQNLTGAAIIEQAQPPAEDAEFTTDSFPPPSDEPSRADNPAGGAAFEDAPANLTETGPERPAYTPIRTPRSASAIDWVKAHIMAIDRCETVADVEKQQHLDASDLRSLANVFPEEGERAGYAAAARVQWLTGDQG